ncbi:hypothetical protein O6H91_11G078900 [Diphasiastrum complanatum]|uniref:Uncharacterized protein n=1 Tax=Diphasiastrum complanatum TaxID=34168 RepID=A0ACC2CB86_DIPCM|nr:hypothetical protein O6H91_11G078900 [Diphasiastrum complanatum]
MAVCRGRPKALGPSLLLGACPRAPALGQGPSQQGRPSCRAFPSYCVGLQVAHAHAHLLEAQARLRVLTVDFVKPFVLKAAILLRIPDIIATAAGPDGSLSLQQIVDQLPSHTVQSDYLYQILRFLVAIKVFDEVLVEAASGEKEKRFRLTPVSKLLLKDSPICFAPMVLLQTDQVCQAPWHHLHEVVSGGGQAFTKAHGKDIWEVENENPALNLVFNNGMVAASRISMHRIVQQYDGFQSLKSLVNVGGGLGETISQIVAVYPHIHGIIYDLPHVIAIAPHIGGSMFEIIPSADAILLKKVMHDWDDDHCMKVLLNCIRSFQMMESLLLQTLLTGLIADMVMIAHSNGGKERREDEWQNLLNGAEACSIISTMAAEYSKYIIKKPETHI